MPMLAFRMTRRCIGLDAAIWCGMPCSFADGRNARANIDNGHARARLGRHECIQHDRCVVVCRRGFVRVRNVCVAGRGLKRARNDPGGYGHRRRRRRR
uniref:hypothetical protein n=1 Tax=Burkholderia diffusa TaxID=488732 RepID=UPI0035A8816F